MKAVILIFVLWALGSFGTFYWLGRGYIIPYAGVTMALFALAVWLANKANKKKA